MSTIKSIPFFTATHHLSAEVRTGSFTAEVMAVADPKTKSVRLYTESEIGGATTLWRVAGTELPESEMIISDLNPIKRDGKVNKSATLKRLTDIKWWEIYEGGEFTAIRTEVKTIPQAATLTKTTPVDVQAAPDGVPVDAKADDAITAALDEAEAHLVAGEKAGAEITAELGPAPKRPRVVGAKKTKAPKAPKEKTHREGSVMSMTVEELRAEFKRITTQDSPSMSLHYNRKLVLGARRGMTRVLNRRTSKNPTLTLTLDQVRALVGSDEAAKHVVGEYLAQWWATHGDKVEAEKAA